MEKPLAASAEDADAIVAAADGSKQLVGMDIGMRWNPALAALRQEVASGSLGNLTAARLTMHYKQWPREWQVQEWCAGRAEGGPLREVGTHYFFGIMEIFGHGCVRRVQARVVYPDGPEGTTHQRSSWPQSSVSEECQRRHLHTVHCLQKIHPNCTLVSCGGDSNHNDQHKLAGNNILIAANAASSHFPPVSVRTACSQSHGGGDIN